MGYSRAARFANGNFTDNTNNTQDVFELNARVVSIFRYINRGKTLYKQNERETFVSYEDELKMCDTYFFFIWSFVTEKMEFLKNIVVSDKTLQLRRSNSMHNGVFEKYFSVR